MVLRVLQKSEKSYLNGRRVSMQENIRKNEFVERYLYDVVRRLPEKQKEDIEKELGTLIEDMLEERLENGESLEKNIIAVLEELGEPALLAAKYRGEEAHLIGGEYYPMYCQVLKVVLICVGIGTGVSFLVSLFINTKVETMDGFIRFIQGNIIDLCTLPMALVQAFGWVTLAFFLLEKKQVKLQEVKGPWEVSKLPLIPYRKAVIAKSDCIVGIVFGILFAVWFICAPEYIGAWIKNSSGEMISVSVFNMSNWGKIMPLLVFSFALGILDEFVKLVVGYYNRTVMWVTVVSNSIGMVLAVYLFKFTQLFNPDFAAEITDITGRAFSAKHDVLARWNMDNGGFLANILLGIILICSCIEIVVAVYRTLRYEGRAANK